MSHLPVQMLPVLSYPAAIGTQGTTIQTSAGPIQITTGAVGLTATGWQSLPKSNPVVLWEMDPSGIPGYAHGQILETRSTMHAYANDPAPDPFVGFGIWSANVDLNGVRIDTTREAFTLRFEDNWKNPTLPGAETDTEFHIQFQDMNQVSDSWYRPFTTSFINGNLVNSLSVAHMGQLYRYYDSTAPGNELISWVWQDVWSGANPKFSFTVPTGISWDLYGRGDVNGAGGRIQLYPSSLGNFQFKIDFGGGSGEQVRLTGVNGHQPTWMVAGPSDDARGELWLYNVGPNTGLALGIGVIPTAVDASPVASRLYLKDGASIKLDGTTTGLTILTAAGQKLGFYGGTPQAQATVTGAKGGNAALTSLVSVLAAMGLFVDGTT